MKRFTLRLLTVLGLSLVAYALAQDTTTPPADAAGASAAQGGMSGGMERMNRQGAMGEHPGTEYQGPEYQGMMPMMQMMNACASMMQHMTQMMSGAQAGAVGMTAGQMDMGQMNASGAARLDPTAAAAIARAFLTGRAPEGAAVEVQEVALAGGRYAVAYRQGDASGTLTIDAATGEVQPQAPDR